MADDVASGAVKYLSSQAAATAAVGSFPAGDVNSSLASKPWIFKDDLLVRMEGQGSASQAGAQALAVVCSVAGGWAVPEPLVTPRYIRLQVDYYADTQRDAANMMVETSGEPKRRLAALFDALHAVLQRTDPDMQVWGDLRTVGCQLLNEPIKPIALPDGDGVWMTTAYYGVMVFGTVPPGPPVITDQAGFTITDEAGGAVTQEA